MRYEVLYDNDDGTSKVKMTIDDCILEQDFANGESADDFNSSVTAGMAVFRQELGARKAVQESYTPDIQVVEVDSLPEVS